MRSTSATADPRVVVDVPVPRLMTQRVLQRTMEQITGVPVPQVVEEIVQEEIVDLVRLTSATVDRRVNVDVPVPQIMEENVEVVKMSSRSVSRNVCSQIIDEPVPQFERDRRAGEVDECNSGPSNYRVCTYSTDYGGAGSRAHRGADYRCPRTTGRRGPLGCL